MKKIVSILIVLIMVIGFLDYMQVESVAAPASSSDPNMDALTALGIDSSQAPEGYDPWSTDNPYGRDTIEISPVYELYTVGLKTPVNYPSQFETNEQEIFTGVERSEKTTKTNELQSTLYGHEVWEPLRQECFEQCRQNKTTQSRAQPKQREIIPNFNWDN